MGVSGRDWQSDLGATPYPIWFSSRTSYPYTEWLKTRAIVCIIISHGLGGLTGLVVLTGVSPIIAFR